MLNILNDSISSAVMFLSLLNATLDPSILESSAIIRYLLPRGYYTSLKQATEKIVGAVK